MIHVSVWGWGEGERLIRNVLESSSLKVTWAWKRVSAADQLGWRQVTLWRLKYLLLVMVWICGHKLTLDNVVQWQHADEK